jgi:hypothetical protein
MKKKRKMNNSINNRGNSNLLRWFCISLISSVLLTIYAVSGIFEELYIIFLVLSAIASWAATLDFYIKIEHLLDSGDKINEAINE